MSETIKEGKARAQCEEELAAAAQKVAALETELKEQGRHRTALEEQCQKQRILQAGVQDELEEKTKALGELRDQNARTAVTLAKLRREAEFEKQLNETLSRSCVKSPVPHTGQAKVEVLCLLTCRSSSKPHPHQAKTRPRSSRSADR